MAGSRARASVVALCACLLGCGETTTEIVVDVRTDLRVPSEIDAVHFAYGTDEEATVRKAVSSPDDFPLRWVIVSGGKTDSVTVQVRGMKGESLIVSRTAMRAFVSGKSRKIALDLHQLCVGKVCQDSISQSYTCAVDNGCAVCEGVRSEWGVPSFNTSMPIGPCEGSSIDAGLDDGGAP